MPNIRIIKLKVRRGSEAERKIVVLEQGELGYTVDTKRLFVGNGFTPGGETVASKIHEVLPTSDSRNLISTAYQNDLVYENNFLYQLTGTDYSKLSAWSFVGAQVNNNSIEYDANRKLSIKSSGITTPMLQPSAITAGKLNSNVVFVSGGLTLNSVSGLSANMDPNVFHIVDNVIKIRADTGISSINSSALSKGLAGGSGSPLSASVDFDSITFNSSGQLTIGTIDGSKIKLGEGMSYDLSNKSLGHIIKKVDDNFYLDSGLLRMQNKLTYNNRQYISPNIITDKAGLILSIDNNICLPLSSSTSPFAGFASQLSGLENRRSTVTAATGVGASNISLSSAGFMVTRIGTPNITTGDTRNFLNSQYVAIPIFTVPQSVIDLVSSTVTLRYPYTYFGYRAYDPSGTYVGELCSAVLTAAACSGINDWTDRADGYDIYSADNTLRIGSLIAASVDVSATVITPTLSGWWAIDNKIYFVNSSNTITTTGTC
jgi:hypothetical protein